MNNRSIGLCVTGSFCTFSAVLPCVRSLCQRNTVTAILSPAAAQTDTRFFQAEDLRAHLCEITGRLCMTTIAEAEQIGPKKLFDVLLVAPCTGNTMAKLAHNITDTAVLMAIKSQLRNARPVVLAFSTNDALSSAAANIGALMNRRDVYFVPFGQDDPQNKPRSAAARFDRMEEALDAAMEGKQLQPILLGPKSD